MSYRTVIEGFQIFGNNEYYPEWIDFIEQKGIAVDGDGCYEGFFRDFMGGLSVMESIVMRLQREREELFHKCPNAAKNGSRGIFDLTNIYINQKKLETETNLQYKNSLFDEIHDAMQTGCMFLPVAYYNACREKLIPDKHFAYPDHFHCFKVKPYNVLHVRAG